MSESGDTEEIVLPPPVAPRCGCEESQTLRSKMADIYVWAGAVARWAAGLNDDSASDVQRREALGGIGEGAAATASELERILGIPQPPPPETP